MYDFKEFLNRISIKYDNWDDFGNKNTCSLMIDDSEVLININPNDSNIYESIKSGKKPEIENFVVLGGKTYYDLINSKISSKSDREKWYKLTNDLAYNIDLLEKILANEYNPNLKDIITKSFLRFRSYHEVKYQLRRMTLGGKYLDSFKIDIYDDSKEKNVILRIDVNPENDIVENTFGIIGKNGTGKTYFLNNLTKLFLNKDSIFNSDSKDISGINKVIHVSYSPFDRLNIESNDTNIFEKIGLYDDKVSNLSNNIYDYLNDQLKNCINEICIPQNSPLKEFLIGIINNFENESWVSDFLQIINTENNDLVIDIGSFSSGQKIVILSIIRLILKVREKSLVLIDEPELFLHPSLVKSYVRSIIEIITKMNGICVMATHNPLILQELQTNCVVITSVHNKKYELTNFANKGINSYGENINILNNVVFGIDIQNTGYYQYLNSLSSEDLRNKYYDLKSILGSEGRVLLMCLMEDINEKNK